MTKLFNPLASHYISVEVLDFDPDNPRFASLRNRVLDEAFDTICDVFEVRRLVASIVTGGYHGAEPLLVLPNGNRYTVLDGNRRLAAIRIILNREIHTHHYPQWLGEPRGECLESIREVPMMVVNDRQDAWPLLARRHGMGTIKWDNYGRASFFQHVSDSYTVPDYQLANHLGVGRRELRGFLMPNGLINAAERAGVWSRSRMEGKWIYYSLVARALQDERIQRFVGISRLGSDDYSALNIENTGRLLAWLLGDREKGIRPVLRDTEADIPKLGRVVECDEAMRYLDEQGWLDHAYQIAIKQDFPLDDDLHTVHNKLWDMLAYLPGQEISCEAEGLAKQVKRSADDLYERILKKGRKAHG